MSRNGATAQDYEMMGKALDEARKALDEGKVGVGALLLWRNEILAINHNNYQETHDLTAHAEMTVLRQVAERLDSMSEEDKKDLTLYTTLQSCMMCFAAMSFVGIHRAVYSALNADGKEDVQISKDITIERLNASLVRGPMTLIPGVRREEGKELLARMEKLG